MIEEEGGTVICHTHIHHSLLQSSTDTYEKHASTKQQHTCMCHTMADCRETGGSTAQQQPSQSHSEKQDAHHTTYHIPQADTTCSSLECLHVTEYGSIQLKLPKLIESDIDPNDNTQAYRDNGQIRPQYPTDRKIAPPQRDDSEQQGESHHIPCRTDIHGETMKPHLPHIPEPIGIYIGIVGHEQELTHSKEKQQVHHQAQKI